MYTKIQICKCTDAKMCWGSMEQMWDFGTRLRILIPCDWWSDKHKLLISIFEYEYGYLNINPTRNEYLMLASFIIMRKRHSQSLHIKLIRLIRKKNTNTNTNTEHKYKYKYKSECLLCFFLDLTWLTRVPSGGKTLDAWVFRCTSANNPRLMNKRKEKRKKRKIFAKSRFSAADEP